MIYAISILLAAVAGLVWLMRRDSRQLGKKEETQEVMEQILGDTYLSKRARENLRRDHDSDAAHELRDKYTRD